MASEGAKRPLEPVSDNPQNASKKRAKRASPSEKASGWDASGPYTLQCTKKADAVDASDYVLDLHHVRNGAEGEGSQFYGFFQFPNLRLKGVMRLAPKSAYDDQDYGRLFTDEFDQACQLPADFKLGPKSKDWIMRWRGEEDIPDYQIKKVGGETRAQAQFVFNLNREASADEPSKPRVQILFAMVHHGKHLLFEGTQAAPASRPPESNTESQSVTKMLEDWTRFHDELWEMAPEPPPDDETWTHHNGWENPFPGGLIKARNKPGPIRGHIINPSASSPYLVEPPEWSWDVSGKYDLICVDLMAELGIGEPGEFSMPPCMTIWNENHAKHTKVGRQLWAHIDMSGLSGVARFRPGPADISVKEPEEASIEDFEKACVLPPDAWVGPAPRGGTLRWEMRWRGFADANMEYCLEDEWGSLITFAQLHGAMVFQGFIYHGASVLPITGVRRGPPLQRSPARTTPNTEWPRHLPRVRLGYYL
ncbi:hypothetical protein F4778DRAFT_126909 [Xylariomycetidae sp. FL2044]|nr:hypothetical protein F4778DRAFT_126909 [Xylariomycetidae sp. FL2044]